MTIVYASDTVGEGRILVEEWKERRDGSEGRVAITTRSDSASHLLGQLNVSGTLTTKSP